MAKVIAFENADKLLGIRLPKRFALHRIVPISQDVELTAPWHEALIRPTLTSPNGGVVAFIEALYRDHPPACVDHGVMRRVTEWQGNSEGPSRVSINIHPESLLDERFLNDTAETAARNFLSGHQLCLELLEYGDCSDKAALVRNTEALRQAGILIALDDFGTRVNCFDLCGTGIVDILKIDASVTREICSNPNQRAVVRSIVTLAQGLNAEVIAEGVEKQSQLDMLIGLGVEFAQGFLLHRPEVRITE
jgi:EAL domain-containing protein (putative c-di-GMP-specific phosphodiesterase class I)